jgi:hypothetical protein
MNSIKNVLLQLQPFLESGQGECKVNDVIPALFEKLEAHMVENGQAGVWRVYGEHIFKHLSNQTNCLYQSQIPNRQTHCPDSNAWA